MARRRNPSLAPAVAQLVLLIVCGAVFSPFLRGALLWFGLVAVAGVGVALAFRLWTRSAVSDSDHSRVLNVSTTVPAQAYEPFSSASVLERGRALDWFQFEKLVEALYVHQGYSVQRFGGANPDGGIDLVVSHDGFARGVQCKHWKTWKVGVKQLREFLGALTDRGLSGGIFVTLQDYSPDARDFAARHRIELVGSVEFERMLDAADGGNNPALLSILNDTRKYCPKCEAEMVRRTATKGRDVGRQFWGCSAFPRCRFTLPVT